MVDVGLKGFSINNAFHKPVLEEVVLWNASHGNMDKKVFNGILDQPSDWLMLCTPGQVLFITVLLEWTAIILAS